MAGVGTVRRRIRIPLALVVSRYFLYVLVGVLLAVGVPAGAFSWQMGSGAILAANYGETHLDEAEDVLVGQASFDASAIPSAYRYARFGADGALLSTDMPSVQLDAARNIGITVSGSEDTRTAEAAPWSFYAVVGLADGGRCVLCYDIVPQWADKGMRDALPNPQDLAVWTALLSLVIVVALIALRAARTLARKMDPLVRAAEAVGRQDLDAPVEGGDVVEIDDVLRAMEGMRTSLKESIEAQRETERKSREQVAALAHDLKTPLTVALGNAELLAEDAEAGRIGEEQAACVRAVRDAALSMDAFVGRIVEASRGRADALRRELVDPASFADGLEDEAGRLVAARGLALEASREPTFQELCDAVAAGEAPAPRWDAGALGRAVLNLLGNACDHARTGPVTLALSCDASAGVVSIAVEDDGPGFSPEALERGAERFFRGDVSRCSGAGGDHFGLGLAIAADIAEAHGGALVLSNHTDGAGKVLGARAVLTIPLT